MTNIAEANDVRTTDEDDFEFAATVDAHAAYQQRESSTAIEADLSGHRRCSHWRS